MNETRPMHRRWIGSLLSLLFPGAGIFLAGDRRAGLGWFCGLMILEYVLLVLAPRPRFPGLAAFVILLLLVLAAGCWMLVRSYRPVPRLRWFGWLVVLVLSLALGAVDLVIGARLMRTFRMPTSSMTPTLKPGDCLLAQTCAYWFREPQRGDIVVFATDNLECAMVPAGQYYIKRIAALPGEKVEVREGALVVNDKPLETPPALAGGDFAPPSNQTYPALTNALVLTAGSFFVVGDNHHGSLDSRHFGSVARENIIGKATKIYWPPSRAGDLR